MENIRMHADPSNIGLIMESVKFFCWIVGSIFTLGVSLLGLYLKMYVKQALQEHTELIEAIIATTYVRKDLHDEQIRNLHLRITEAQA